MTTPKTILLQVNSRYAERPEFEEQVDTGDSITPGMLIQFETTGLVKPHATANGNAQPMFALEPLFTGTDVATAAIDTPWTPTNGPCRYIYAQPGDLIYALLEDEANVAKGAPLASAGDGTLQAITVDATAVDGSVVAYAAEAVNNVGGSGAVRIRVRVA